MARFDLTDFEWSVIQPLLPTKVRGVKRVDDRRVLNGIFWRLRTGAPWADDERCCGENSLRFCWPFSLDSPCCSERSDSTGSCRTRFHSAGMKSGFAWLWEHKKRMS